MFVEKLTEDNLNNFRFLGLKITKSSRDDCSMNITLENGAYLFAVKDFYVAAKNERSLTVVDMFQKVWREFMLDQFGEEYAVALQNRRKMNKQIN